MTLNTAPIYFLPQIESLFFVFVTYTRVRIRVVALPNTLQLSHALILERRAARLRCIQAVLCAGLVPILVCYGV